MGGWVHDMSCCAWLASTFFQPPQPIVSLSPRAPRHPPGTLPSLSPRRPLVPSSRHPLPHRSALMSGKNKTASPTAKAGVSPSPTTANDVVYRKEGVAGIGDGREGTGLGAPSELPKERRGGRARRRKNEGGERTRARERQRDEERVRGAGEREKGGEFREVRR